MKYEMKFYPEGSKKPTASVCVKTDNNDKFENLRHTLDSYMSTMRDHAKDDHEQQKKLGGMISSLLGLDKKKSYTDHDYSGPGTVVCECDGADKAKEEMYINEDDAVAAMLYGCFISSRQSKDEKDATEKKGTKGTFKFTGISYNRLLKGLTVTISYKGDKYTDIPELNLIMTRLGICGFTFTARKNGEEPAQYYLLAKTVINDPDENMNTSQTPSSGIVEVNSDRLYAGCFILARKRRRFTEYDPTPGDLVDMYNSQSWIDDDGNLVESEEFRYARVKISHINAISGTLFENEGDTSPIITEKEDSIPIIDLNALDDNDDDDDDESKWAKFGVPEEYIYTAVHMFFENDGDDFAYSVLINGRLYKKISKTEDAVTFYSTPLQYAGKSASEEEYPHKEQIVFRNTDGKYVNDGYLINRYDNISMGVNSSITLPPVPKKLNTQSMAIFYMSCEIALQKAFEASEKYFTTKYALESYEDEISQPGLRVRIAKLSEKTEKRFGTYDPPACQVDIIHIGDGKYTFPYKDAEITARVCADDVDLTNKTDVDFKEHFQVFFPSFRTESISFKEKGWTIELKPLKKSLDIVITDAKTEQTYSGGLGLLKAHPKFDLTGIPPRPSFKQEWTKVNKRFDSYYKYIKDLIVKIGIKDCEKLLDGNYGIYDEIESELYGEEGMIPDKNVIFAVAHYRNEFKRTKRIPNIAIVGQAGTGKTTIAKKLSGLFEKDISECTPSDLRGPYVGHTKYRLIEKIGYAAANNKVFFVDEAYQLMDDVFGQEAVTILLQMMTSDVMDEIIVSLDKQFDTLRLYFGNIYTGKQGHFKRLNTLGEPVEEYLFDPGIIPVWLAGYDDDVRRMISRNQGLYRRLKKIVISTPVTSQLIDQFNGELNKMIGEKDKISRKATMLKKHFEDNGMDAVRKFFGWGIQPQNSKYFASHAGVSTFLGDCIDTIDFGKDVERQIEDIIGHTKSDIKRQLTTIRTGNEKYLGLHVPSAVDADAINVITDIDVRFNDLVGCNTQIAYMKSIVEMMVNKSDYEDEKLTIPKGALMEGLPGTGKTFIATALAGELQERFQNKAPDKRFGFMSFSAPELGHKPVSYISSIFSTAEEYDACVIFIDEVDAIARHRSDNPFFDRYLELLKQMDGVEKHTNVFILAATNAPEHLDPAFVRSGRIDKKLTFTLPDKSSRRVIAEKAIRDRLERLADFDMQEKDRDIDMLVELTVRRTTGFTAGDIQSIINTAFISYHQYALLDDSDDQAGTIDEDLFNNYQFIDKNSHKLKPEKLDRHIKDGDLRALNAFIDEEIERKHMGAANFSRKEEKFSIGKNGNNCSSTAIHEVGHAIVSLMMGEPFETITIIPRGDILGYVSPSDLKIVTKSDYEDYIRICMGGRIAEEIIYGKDNISTGASSDMQKATYYARYMVEQVGLTDDFGFMTLSGSRGKYLGGDKQYTCSDAFREKGDAAAAELLKKLYNETLGMLANKKTLIERLAKRVFEKESMGGEEFKKLYEKELKRLLNK